MPVNVHGYPKFRGVNQRLDAGDIGPDEVQSTLDATYRDGTCRKRLGLTKIVNDITPGSIAKFIGATLDDSETNDRTKFGNFGIFPHTTAWNTLATASTEWTFEVKIKTDNILPSDDSADITGVWPHQIVQKYGEDFTTPITRPNISVWVNQTDNIQARFWDFANNAIILLTSSTTVATNTVYHIAIIKDETADEIQLWIATGTGTFAEEDQVAVNVGSPTQIRQDGDQLLYIGAREDSGAEVGTDIYTSYSFRGLIGEVRLWSEARSLADLTAYQQSCVPDYAQTNLILYIPLNEGQGNLFTEAVTGQQGVMVNGKPQWTSADALTGTHSMIFNGFTSYIEVGDATLFDALESQQYLTLYFRIKLWKLPDAVKDGGAGNRDYTLVSRHDSTVLTATGQQFAVKINGSTAASSNALQIEWNNSSGTASTVFSTGTLSRDTAHTVIIQIATNTSTGQCKIKIDDNATETKSGAGAAANFETSTEKMYMGMEWVTSTAELERPYLGIYDAFAMWTSAIDPDSLKTEIDASSDVVDPAGILGSQAVLNYRFDLDQSSFDTLFDLSTSKHNGTRKNTEKRVAGVGTAVLNEDTAEDADPIEAPQWDTSFLTPTDFLVINGIFDFEKSGSAEGDEDTSGQHILIHSRNNIFRLVSGTLETIYSQASFNNNFPTLFQPFNNFLIISSRAGNPLEYDGNTVSPLTPETPDPPTDGGAGGGGTLEGAYQFRITFLNKNAGKRSVHSTALTVSGLAASSSRTIDWSAAVAAITEDQISHVELWMTLDGESSGLFFYQGEYALGEGGDQVEVTDDPETTVEVLDITLVKTPRIEYIAAHRQRMFAAKVTDQREIVYSPVNRPEHVEGSIFLQEPCTGLKVQNGQLIIFTRNKKWVLTGSQPLSFDLVPLNQAIGAVGQPSVAENEDVLFYLTRRGPYLDTYNNQRFIGSNIETDVDSWNHSKGTKWLGVYHEKRHQVVFSAILGTSNTENNRLYVLNLPRERDEQEGWEIHSIGLTALASVRDPTTGELKLYGGWNGFLVEVFVGTNDGADGVSDLTGALTSGSTTEAHNVSASWATAGAGLRGVLFENISTGLTSRILSNDATGLTLQSALASTNSSGDTYRLAGIPFDVRTRQENFGNPLAPTFVSELFFDLQQQTTSGDITVIPIINESITGSTYTVTSDSTTLRARRPMARTCKEVETHWSQKEPDIPVEILDFYYRIRPTSKRL
jgi:hypothetical protein